MKETRTIHVDLDELQGPGRGLVMGLILSLATCLTCMFLTWLTYAILNAIGMAG